MGQHNDGTITEVAKCCSFIESCWHCIHLGQRRRQRVRRESFRNLDRFVRHIGSADQEESSQAHDARPRKMRRELIQSLPNKGFRQPSECSLYTFLLIWM